MKCNYKRKINNSTPKWAINPVDGNFRNVPISEEEYIKGIFNQYDMKIVTPKNKLINALKQGDYVIGIDYNPFLFQNVFHYENGILEFFRFADIGDRTMAPLRLKRDTSILFRKNSYSNLTAFVDTMPHYDEFIVCRKGNLLDIENIPPTIARLIG